MHELPDTNESLIARVKDPRDAAAWSEFLAIYRPVVYRLARSRGLQHADAEDLAQQVFMSIARAFERWEPGADMPPFRGWLYRIARNAILKAVTRKKPDRGAGSTSVQELLQETPEAGEEVTAAFLHESRLETFRWAAQEIRSEFTAATWSMFWETSIDGRSVAETAASHGRSAGAVYVARCRVMQRIKERVSDLTQSWDENL